MESPVNPIARSPGQVGNLIRTFRTSKGMSQTQLAERSGLRQELISRIEGGHPGAKISSISALLAALDLEMTIGPRSKSSAADIEDIF
jgi:HTH-type transcriptional regulator/antitoxin HipB